MDQNYLEACVEGLLVQMIYRVLDLLNPRLKPSSSSCTVYCLFIVTVIMVSAIDL